MYSDIWINTNLWKIQFFHCRVRRRGGGGGDSEKKTYLRPATERVEHVKEHKTCEGHSGVSWGDDVVTHLKRMRQLALIRFVKWCTGVDLWRMKKEEYYGKWEGGRGRQTIKGEHSSNIANCDTRVHSGSGGGGCWKVDRESRDTARILFEILLLWDGTGLVIYEQQYFELKW